jgi:hypothetical protein
MNILRIIFIHIHNSTEAIDVATDLHVHKRLLISTFLKEIHYASCVFGLALNPKISL